jgi:hypothetical protein
MGRLLKRRGALCRNAAGIFAAPGLDLNGNRVKIPDGPATVSGEWFFGKPLEYSGKVKSRHEPQVRRPALAGVRKPSVERRYVSSGSGGMNTRDPDESVSCCKPRPLTEARAFLRYGKGVGS